MAGYTQDPNDSSKQVPKPLPDNAYDRAKPVTFYNFTKSPNEVYFGDANDSCSFYFGTSASFANLDITLTGNTTMSFASIGAPKQITGSGTSFTTELEAGDKIEIISASVSHYRTVSSIATNTSMSIAENWTGTGDANTTSHISKIIRRRTFMSQTYENFGTPSDGTSLHIHPTAASGSDADNNKGVVFIYRSGLAGHKRPRR